MLNIITPMVGEDLYETSSDNSFPKILNDIQGKTILEYSQQYLKTISDGFLLPHLRFPCAEAPRPCGIRRLIVQRCVSLSGL